MRQGLLPAPQKTASGRSLFTEDHERLLRKIIELKERNLPLAEVRSRLDQDLAAFSADKRDLEAQETEHMRATILRVATEEFVAHGYRGAHVDTIIRKLGINAHTFYSYFPSKLDLLVECLNTLLSWSVTQVRPQVLGTEDLGERLLRKVAADSGVGDLGADLAAAIRLQGKSKYVDPYRQSEVWAGIVQLAVDDLNSARRDDSTPPPVPLELVAHSFIGALRNANARASWDDRYSRADIYRTHLFMYLAVLSALRGDVDIETLLPRYEPLIEQLAAEEPHIPTATEVDA